MNCRVPASLLGHSPLPIRLGSPVTPNGPHWLVSDADGERRSDQSRHSTGSFRINESDDDMDVLRSTGCIQGGGHHSLTSSHTEEEKMKRRLKYYFMNPWEKWKARHRFPWKMTLQLVKVICVTIQLVVFGFTRASHVTFLDTTAITFKHLYLLGWESAYETMPYPPATGKYAVYTIPNFYASIDYVFTRYNETEQLAIGAYHYHLKNGTKDPIRYCIKKYLKGKLDPHRQSFEFDSRIVTECRHIEPVWRYNETAKQNVSVYDSRAYLESQNSSINFDSVIEVNLSFDIHTIHMKALKPRDDPDCYKFRVQIEYDNSAHDGRMKVELKAHEEPQECNGTVENQSAKEQIESIFLSLFDGLVIVISAVSLILCLRSIIKAQQLKMEVVKFFKKEYNKELSVNDRCEFVNTWYVLIVINDIFTIAGSIFKIEIQSKSSHNYEACGVLLGTGNLLVWFGVLRYLEFYPKYNILILTMKKSAPNILRYLLCAAIFYLGFTFCGWVVLGPYHIKFRNLSTASECLFSLVNGDDMFVTFSAIKSQNTYVWWYSRVYLYVFISLFIYVVLSVFISVIMDTYETIKHYYENGFPKSELAQFMDECTEHPTSPLYRSDADESWTKTLNCFGCCFTCPRCPRRSETKEVSTPTSDASQPDDITTQPDDRTTRPDDSTTQPDESTRLIA